MVSRCAGRNTAGDPCEAQPVRPDGYCWWHSPAAAAEREEARRRGGHNRSNKQRAKRQLPAEPMTADELHAWLGIVFKRVIVGQVEPNVATAAASVAKAMVAVAEAGAVERLEERLAELERLAARGTA